MVRSCVNRRSNWPLSVPEANSLTPVPAPDPTGDNPLGLGDWSDDPLSLGDVGGASRQLQSVVSTTEPTEQQNKRKLSENQSLRKWGRLATAVGVMAIAHLVFQGGYAVLTQLNSAR